MNWFSRLFADATGEPDDARVAAFLIVLTFIGNSVSAVWLNPSHAFDAQSFGLGAGGLATGIGVWFGARKAN